MVRLYLFLIKPETCKSETLLVASIPFSITKSSTYKVRPQVEFNPLHFIQIICTRDFKWCHTFSKLKTLFLNEWCLAADFGELVYFLQHSPILERLTLQLRFHEVQYVF